MGAWGAFAACFLYDCKPNGKDMIYNIKMMVRVSQGALTAKAAINPTTNIVKSINLC